MQIIISSVVPAIWTPPLRGSAPFWTDMQLRLSSAHVEMPPSSALVVGREFPAAFRGPSGSVRSVNVSVTLVDMVFDAK